MGRVLAWTLWALAFASAQAAADLKVMVAVDPSDREAIVISVIEGQKTAFALGADDFCTKPVERAWLVERLTKLSGRNRLDKILIVDDDDASRYLLRTLISQVGGIGPQRGD